MDLDPSDVDNKFPLIAINEELDIIDLTVDSDDELTVDSTSISQDHEGNNSSTQPENMEYQQKPNIHILDKALSIEEDVLDIPLEPLRASNSFPGRNRNIISECGEPGLTPILCRESRYTGNDSTVKERSKSTRVSFPTDDSLLAVCGDQSANHFWEINSDYTADEILKIYQNSCKSHKTIELDVIKRQIQEVKNNRNHTGIFNLTSVEITLEVNETLEDLFKICNFRTLVLHDCKFTPSTITDFIRMIEYYESVCEIELETKLEDLDTWRAFCHACGNLSVLESISFKGMIIIEQYMCMLLKTLKKNTNISVLRFDTCILTKLPSFYLIDNLVYNTTLRELYLPSSGLYTKEADMIGRLLLLNFRLKVLDLSHNFIGDRGFEVLARGLQAQNKRGHGLSVFIIVNNQLTEKSGPTIGNIILKCKNLHTLNVGYNNLTDQVIDDMTEGLAATNILEGLGLQNTLLTCKGIGYLAAAIKKNTSLQKINLKGNKGIQVAGLETLCNALPSTKISKIEIDETNRFGSDPEAYSQMVKKLHAICAVNKSYIEANGEEEYQNISQLIARKISLSCEPRYLLPDVTTAYQVSSPVSPTCAISTKTSTTTTHTIKKSRFQITKVQDSKMTSRFKVTTVTAPLVKDKKQESASATASPNDSVDSLDENDIMCLDTDDV